MNKVFLTGNLTADPEMRTTNSGLSCCQFRLAVQRRFKNASGEREADFIPVIAWRQLADLCHQYLSKGRKCAVAGSIQTRTYDAQDGSKRYVTEIIADEIEFLGANANQNAANANQNTGFAPPSSGHQTGFGYIPPMGDDQAGEEDDLPF